MRGTDAAQALEHRMCCATTRNGMSVSSSWMANSGLTSWARIWTAPRAAMGKGPGRSGLAGCIGSNTEQRVNPPPLNCTGKGACSR